jgi:hypothetical protein
MDFMKTKILFSTFLMIFPLIATAATEFNIKVKNKTDYDAYVSIAPGNEDWRCFTLCTPQVVKAHSTSKFYTDTPVLNYFFAEKKGMETIHISYGQTKAKAQMWIDHPYSVEENIKTAIIHVAQSTLDKSTEVYANIAGVGTDSENVLTDFYIEQMAGGYTGKAYITLTLT